MVPERSTKGEAQQTPRYFSDSEVVQANDRSAFPIFPLKTAYRKSCQLPLGPVGSNRLRGRGDDDLSALGPKET